MSRAITSQALTSRARLDIQPYPKPKIYDEGDRHGLTCHVTCRDELASDMEDDETIDALAIDDVAATCQMR
jgi:hypothetical protein